MDKKQLEQSKYGHGGGPSMASAPRARTNQEKYDELDAMVVSQLDPSIVQLGSSPDEGGVQVRTEPESLTGVPASVDKLCSKLISLELRRNNLSQRKKDLTERHEQQKQTLFSLQMELEQRGQLLQAKISGRDSIELKIRQCSQLTESLHQYCSGINQTLSQMSEVKNEISDQVLESVGSFGSIQDKIHNMQIYLGEAWKLQLAIAEQQRINKEMEEKFQEVYNLEVLPHHQVMSELNEQKAEIALKLKEKELQLESAKKKVSELCKSKMDIVNQSDMDVGELEKKLQCVNLRERTSKADLEKAQLEKENVAAQVDEILQKNSNLNGSLSMLEKKQNDLEKKRENLEAALTESESQKENIALECKRVQLQNAKANLTLEEMREKINNTKVLGKKKIFELQDNLGKIKVEASTSSDELSQKLLLLQADVDNRYQKCADLENSVSRKTFEIESLKLAADSALSTKSTLECRLEDSKAKVDTLNREVQEIHMQLKCEKEKESQIEELMLQHKTEAMKDIQHLQKEVVEAERKCLSAKRTLQQKRTNVNLLTQKLEQINGDSDKIEKSAVEKYGASIRELEEKIAEMNVRKEHMKEENQVVARSLHDELRQHNHLLTSKEEEILESINTHNMTVKELESCSTDLTSLRLQIETQLRIENELKLSIQQLQEQLQGMNVKLSGMDSINQKEETLLQVKGNEAHEIQLKLHCLEKNKTDAISKNSEAMKVLFQEIAAIKQNCESASINISQLDEELDTLKKFHRNIKIEGESMEKQLSMMDDQNKTCNLEMEKKKLELENLKKSYENSQVKIKSLKRETLSANNLYQKLCKGIAAAKAKKRSLLAKAASEKSSHDESSSPTVNLVSNEDKEGTARSILKPSHKPPTPQSAKKNVSFLVDDDIESSSSTVIL